MQQLKKSPCGLIGGKFVNTRVLLRLQNSRIFFLKIIKEIGKAWRKSLTCVKCASLTRP